MKKLLTLIFGLSLILLGCGGGGGGSSSSSETAGPRLSGTITGFELVLNSEEKSMFAAIKDFFFRGAHATVSGISDITVAIGALTTTTDSDGGFTINDIPTGDQIITFTKEAASEEYLLKGIEEGEVFTLNGIEITGEWIATEHTGTWSGTIEMGHDGENWSMTLLINTNGNSLSGDMTTGEGESGTFSGTETGTSLDATYTVSDGECTLSGPLTGTFSGTTLTGNAPVTADTCGLQPGDSDSDSHPFILNKLPAQ